MKLHRHPCENCGRLVPCGGGEDEAMGPRLCRGCREDYGDEIDRAYDEGRDRRMEEPDHA